MLLMFSLCVSGIWWSHRWTWHFERGFLQRQHPDHATTKGQPDCEFKTCCFYPLLISLDVLFAVNRNPFLSLCVPSCGHQKTRQMRERPETGKTNGIALLIHLHSYLKHRQLIYIPLHSISSSHFCMTSSLNCSWPTSFTPLSSLWGDRVIFQLADSVTLWKHVVLISESMLLLFMSALRVCLYVASEQVWKEVKDACMVWGGRGVFEF